MSTYQFRVTVEDLDTGDRQVMEFAPGDYTLVAFEPCHRAGLQVSPGTNVITINGYAPQMPARTIDAGTAGGTR